MTKVNNRSVIRRLALRDMISNRKMNCIVIVSIMLTCILFTALTSIGGSLINGAQQETMRQVGGNKMAGVKWVLPEDLEKLEADNYVFDVVYRIIVGYAVNEDMKLSAEFNYAGNDEAAKAMFSYPKTGRLPENIDDIAVSTLVLDSLGIEHKIGEKVPIKLDIDGTVLDYTFTLCGYWDGDKVALAQICWVSQAFIKEYAPTPSESFYSQEHVKYAGYYMVDFNYANSWDIEGKTNALIERLYEDGNAPDTGINWAYTTSSVDAGSLVCGIVMAFIVFAAGYLIIYNIFYINISANIRSYGLLKTIGTTSRQIKTMVRFRAALYCAVGIPLGLIAGTLLGKLLIKAVVTILNTYSADSYSISPKLLFLICLISAAFTFTTVMVSCSKPCRYAGNVSPIEALRYSGTDIHTKKKDKKTGKVTPLSIAHSNMMRSRKKTVVVVLSLTLSMVLVNTLFTVLGGIDRDKYVGNSIVGDIVIRHNSKTDLWDDLTKGVTTEMIEDIRTIDGADVHPVYFEKGSVVPQGKQLEQIRTLNSKYGSEESISIELDAALRGEYIANIYGIDEKLAECFEPIEGSIDIKKLMTGKYAIVHTYLWNAEGDSSVELYHAGDKITVECGGREHEYEVMAVCGVPYSISTKVYSIFSTQVIIPTDEYMSLTDEPAATCIMINTDDSSGRVKEQCRAYCDQKGCPLVYFDKQTYLDEFSDLLRMVKLLGGTLTAVLALIGILNFVNAVVTGIISRKREIAMMNAVGMTGSQTKRMLMWEGIYYALLTALFSAAGSTVLSLLFIKGAAKELFFFSYHFTLMPICIGVPVLLIISMIIPYAVYMKICKKGIVDRMRETE